MTNNRKILFISTVTLLVAGLLLRFLVLPNHPANHPPLRLASNVWAGYAHLHIAKEKGIFTKNGVEVSITLNQEVSQSTNQFKTGEADGFFSALTDVVMLNATGIPAKVVYIADYSQSADVIVGRGEFASLANLKGHVVSFEKLNSFSHLYVLKALEKQGLNESQVRFAIVPPQNVLEALEQGRIHAGHTWEPITSQAIAKGYKILSQAGDIPGIITDTLAFNSKIIQERPNDVQAVVKSMLEAQAFVMTHKEEAVAIMAKAQGMTPDEMSSGLDGVAQGTLKANITGMTRSADPSSLYGSGEMIIEYLLNRGQLRTKPNLEMMIDDRFVKTAQ
ncbi:MAG: ABC transporter substrate-binding protein [Magnetococcales bacterium]|nr:ABC transporter substrate-binding protein [Magnetococcales bacterium]MBF0439109.1 ABC transporter substrate-binding protein [Magnetococcales bacterium]